MAKRGHAASLPPPQSARYKIRCITAAFFHGKEGPLFLRREETRGGHGQPPWGSTCVSVPSGWVCSPHFCCLQSECSSLLFFFSHQKQKTKNRIARVVWVGLCAQTGLAIAFAPYFVLSHLDQMALWGGVSGGMLAFSLLSLSLVRYAFKRKVSSIHAPASLLASSPASTSTSAGESNNGESNNEEGPLVRVTRWQHPFKQREELVPAKELQERCYLAVDGTLYVTYPDYRQLRYIVQRDGFIHNADLFAKIFPVAAQAAASALNADYAQTSAEFDKATIPSSADAAASAAPPSSPASSTTTAASTTQSSPSGGARKTHHKGNRQK
ncbi:hypothetical protein QOT17_021968 [Balamuthia mandrillaris]